MKGTIPEKMGAQMLAALFGKSQTRSYRQIYAGKVTAITKHGRILIPAADVERILAEAGIYNGEK